MKLFSVLMASAMMMTATTAAAVNNLQPDELVSEYGALDVTLDITLETSLDGRRVAPNYNGKPMGPTLRVKPGDVLTLTLNNMLEPGSDVDRELFAYTMDPQNEIADFVNMTIVYNRLSEVGRREPPQFGFWGLNYANVHFHGADFPAAVEDLMNALDGGESKTITIEIPLDQEPGLFWYHNHFHGKTAYDYLAGLYGFFVIEGTEDDVANGLNEEATETFLLLGEFFPESPNSTTPAREIPFAFAFDWLSVTNGVDGATAELGFEENELVHFRVASAATEQPIFLSIIEEGGAVDSEPLTMLPIAYDGFPAPSKQEVQEIVVSAGQRVDFLVRFEKAGRYTIRRAPWVILGASGVEGCTMFFGAPVPVCASYDVEKQIATVVVTQSRMLPIEAPTPLIDTIDLPGYNAYHQALAAMPIVDTKFITLETTFEVPFFQVPYDSRPLPPGGNVAFGINGLLVTPFANLGTVTAGTCESWEVSQNIPVQHPFHVHQADFMVTHIDGVALAEPIWRDTQEVTNQNITIKICFDRSQPGERILFHCHMAVHQDSGMSGYYEVVAAPTPAPEPTAAPVVPEPTSAPVGRGGGTGGMMMGKAGKMMSKGKSGMGGMMFRRALGVEKGAAALRGAD